MGSKNEPLAAENAVDETLAKGASKAGKPAATTETIAAGKIPPAAEPTSADLAALRAKHNLPSDLDTIAVGKTNVKGLESETFEGMSPAVRKAAGLSDLNEAMPNRPIRAPKVNPAFTRHAEEDLANDFVAKVEAAGLKSHDLDGKTLNIRISYNKGVCTNCMQGLNNSNVAPGVLKQLSQMYPGLTIRVAAEGGNASGKRAILEILNGKFIN